ncbi:hypothetical protein [Alcanivorax limicola]|nr:hypothetical protein [Alcanivorax limicola]
MHIIKLGPGKLLEPLPASQQIEPQDRRPRACLANNPAPEVA